MLTLADIELGVPTPEFAAAIKAFIPLKPYWQILTRNWPGNPVSAILGYPLNNEHDPGLEINRYCHPRGASRVGHGTFICDTARLQQIAQAAFGTNGQANNKLFLKMDFPPPSAPITAPPPESIALPVYLLPPVPIRQISFQGGNGPASLFGETINGYYLITVVDQRWLWWQTPCPNIANLSWTAAIGAISGAVGTGIIVDKVDPRFLSPHPNLACMQGEACAMVLDALAFNIGMRLSIDLTGQPSVNMPLTDVKTRTQDDAQVPSRPVRLFQGGGDVFNQPNDGPDIGLNPAANLLSSLLPSNIYVRFTGKGCLGKAGQASVNQPYYEDTIQIGSVNFWGSNYAGNNATKIFHDAAYALFPAGGGGGGSQPSNVTEIQNLTEAVAECYYNWKSLFLFDRIYAGIVAYAPEGFTDVIEWTYRLRDNPSSIQWIREAPGPAETVVNSAEKAEVTTRAYTAPYNSEPEELHHYGTDCGTGAVQICGPPEIDIPAGSGTPRQRCYTLYNVISTPCQPLALVSTGQPGCCSNDCCSTSTAAMGVQFVWACCTESPVLVTITGPTGNIIATQTIAPAPNFPQGSCPPSSVKVQPPPGTPAGTYIASFAWAGNACGNFTLPQPISFKWDPVTGGGVGAADQCNTVPWTGGSFIGNPVCPNCTTVSNSITPTNPQWPCNGQPVNVIPKRLYMTWTGPVPMIGSGITIPLDLAPDSDVPPPGCVVNGSKFIHWTACVANPGSYGACFYLACCEIMLAGGGFLGVTGWHRIPGSQVNYGSAQIDVWQCYQGGQFATAPCNLQNPGNGGPWIYATWKNFWNPNCSDTPTPACPATYNNFQTALGTYPCAEQGCVFLKGACNIADPLSNSEYPKSIQTWTPGSICSPVNVSFAPNSNNSNFGGQGWPGPLSTICAPSFSWLLTQ